MTLRTPGGSSETATIQRTISTTVAVPECMQDSSDARSPESFCGVNGICTGPSGCDCDPRWYGIQCDNQSEELIAPEFVWRGWTVLFIIVILGARRTERFCHVCMIGAVMTDGLCVTLVLLSGWMLRFRMVW
eukprot:COSAG02_NODE_3268_length_7047_cov_3.408463_4_plen_132_part_00